MSTDSTWLKVIEAQNLIEDALAEGKFDRAEERKLILAALKKIQKARRVY